MGPMFLPLVDPEVRFEMARLPLVVRWAGWLPVVLASSVLFRLLSAGRA